MIPLRSITSRTITAPASLVRRSTRASITTPALKLGWKVDGVSPMGCSALADIAAQIPESATHLAQEPAQSAVSTNIVGLTFVCGEVWTFSAFRAVLVDSSSITGAVGPFLAWIGSGLLPSAGVTRPRRYYEPIRHLRSPALALTGSPL